ncbi:MAG TPA: pyrroline-5-carboxylate reductase [Chthoniobacteraceae bacterium]|jgi:pyrroline-5-carboxylate reductase|nr:pyrroline-5-carboxylate reductase [Chthoniobacteraceae bacterium]
MKFGFIGSGKMASALVRGVTKSGAIPAELILVTDVLPAVAQKLATEAGATALTTNKEVAAGAETLILCVKPQDALGALRGVDTKGKLIVSIVAGLTIAALQEAAASARIIRVMPNTPALVHQGAAAYALGDGATNEDAAVAEKIFGAVGKVVRVKEALIDVVTGLSGSGPAYIYLVIEALADGAVLMGLPRDLALQLSAQTVLGAASMVLQTGEHPSVLRDQVTSPGGTTIAALEALEASGARAAFIAAVRAATERARELGATK